MARQYSVKANLKPSGLDGISDDQVSQHWKLYEGYVTNVNKLNDEIDKLIKGGQVGTPQYSELKRRLGFEYNGMVLHEYYFSNIKAKGGEPDKKMTLYKLIEENFGSYDIWKNDFASTGKMRGIGWAILYYDPASDSLTNNWITLHEDGNPAGFIPILVMDVWEHAYMVDYGAGGRPTYIDAFFRNINWDKANSRIEAARKKQIPGRD